MKIEKVEVVLKDQLKHIKSAFVLLQMNPNWSSHRNITNFLDMAIK